MTSIKVIIGNSKYDSRGNCNAIIETASNTLIAGCKNTTIPNSVTLIGNGAFDGSGLTSITIPNSVKSIGDYAFNCCSGLTTVTIGKGVTEVGGGAFYNCNRLTCVQVAAIEPPTIASNTFDKYTATLYIPNGSESKYKNAEYWDHFSSIKTWNP